MINFYCKILILTCMSGSVNANTWECLKTCEDGRIISECVLKDLKKRLEYGDRCNSNFEIRQLVWMR